MCFSLDSWQVARILNLKREMKSDEKVVCRNGFYMTVKKSKWEIWLKKLLKRG